MGANRAIHVTTADAVQPLTAARVFLQLAEGAAGAGDSGQAGDQRRRQPDRPDARRAVGPPAGHLPSKVEIADDKATVTREVDAGLEVIEAELPAVITTDLRLDEPRFIKLPG
ncbi:EtfB protein OS=Rhodanobacter lindaniclasticus OX=75310 GN=B1991_04770 PE=3 SV=1 [Rhodanobacter lindaniclasticus]